MTNATRRAQRSFEESPLDNEKLEDALGDWATAKEQLKPYRRAFKALDVTVKGLIEQAELPDGSYRCGDFIINISEAEEKHIEFERASNRRIGIKVAKR